LHPKVRAHLQRFDVTEDWPLQVAIARQFPERRFKLINEVLVYYRRTTGSTYIVANQRFVKDKIMMYDDLIQHEANWIERVRLVSRKLCFNISGKILKKILNLDLYFFAASLIISINKIYLLNAAIRMNQDQHREHYANIKYSAKNQTS
jgi:hypothetical protein